MGYRAGMIMMVMLAWASTMACEKPPATSETADSPDQVAPSSPAKPVEPKVADEVHESTGATASESPPAPVERMPPTVQEIEFGNDSVSGSLIAGAAYLYWIGTRTISRVPAEGGDPEHLLWTKLYDRPRELAVGDEVLHVLLRDGRVVRIAKSTGKETQVLGKGGASVEMAIGGEHVYATHCIAKKHHHDPKNSEPMVESPRARLYRGQVGRGRMRRIGTVPCPSTLRVAGGELFMTHEIYDYRADSLFSPGRRRPAHKPEVRTRLYRFQSANEKPQVLAKGVGDFQLDGDQIYWSQEGQWVSWDRNDETITEWGQSGNMIVHDERFIFYGDDQAIVCSLRDGSERKTISATKADVRHIATNGTFVFWVERDNRVDRMFRAPLDCP